MLREGNGLSKDIDIRVNILALERASTSARTVAHTFHTYTTILCDSVTVQLSENERKEHDIRIQLMRRDIAVVRMFSFKMDNDVKSNTTRKSHCPTILTRIKPFFLLPFRAARDEIHSHLLLEGKDIGGGNCTRVPVTFTLKSGKGHKGGARRDSGGSDDEPVYDSVASDEDSLDSTSLPR